MEYRGDVAGGHVQETPVSERDSQHGVVCDVLRGDERNGVGWGGFCVFELCVESFKLLAPGLFGAGDGIEVRLDHGCDFAEKVAAAGFLRVGVSGRSCRDVLSVVKFHDVYGGLIGRFVYFKGFEFSEDVGSDKGCSGSAECELYGTGG